MYSYVFRGVFGDMNTQHNSGVLVACFCMFFMFYVLSCFVCNRVHRNTSIKCLKETIGGDKDGNNSLIFRNNGIINDDVPIRQLMFGLENTKITTPFVFVSTKEKLAVNVLVTADLIVDKKEYSSSQKRKDSAGSDDDDNDDKKDVNADELENDNENEEYQDIDIDISDRVLTVIPTTMEMNVFTTDKIGDFIENILIEGYKKLKVNNIFVTEKKM